MKRLGAAVAFVTSVLATACGSADRVAPVRATRAQALEAMTSLSVDTTTSVDGFGVLTTAPISTTASNELLLAFVASDANVEQTVTVSGAGLVWKLVQRANRSPGTAEIWSAWAPAPLTDVTVHSVQAEGGMHQSLTRGPRGPRPRVIHEHPS